MGFESLKCGVIVLAFYSMRKLLFSVNLIIFRDLFFRSLPFCLRFVYLLSWSCLLFELECTEWAWHLERLGKERGVYRVWVRKPEGRRPLGRPMRRWEDNIRVDLQEVRCGGMDWSGLAQDRDRWRALVNAEWTFGFNKTQGISWLATNLLASQEGLCPME
jgi:hypothetical protein